MNRISFLEKINILLIKIIVRFRLQSESEINESNIIKGLIFCQMGIGNCILLLPAINHLIKTRPDIDLTIITNNKATLEILQEQALPANIIYSTFHEKPFFKRIKFFRKIKKEHFQFSIMNFLSQKVPNIHLDIYCKTPVRIGHVTKKAGGRGKWDFFFTHGIDISGKHELDFNLDLINVLTPIHQSVMKNIVLTINKKNLYTGSNFIAKQKKKFKIVMQIYSSHGVQKNWLPEYYIELSAMLVKQFNAILILTGSKNERQKIDEIYSKSKIEYINIAGDFSIMETASIIKQADLFIGNDSGLGHISAALGQKTISIIAMTDYNRIRPRGKNVFILNEKLACSPCDAIGKVPLYKNCPYDYLCKKNITPKKVFNLAQKLLT